ncbi:hypothetical protein [Enterovirga sp. CN4-39]|uniref:hypothetical protein n=1 Tax=Enterovirga sp. CN4-39 TaxID=3400910 RepID=UPI003C0D1C95
MPLIVTQKQFWDHEAADALLAYGAERQMWEATALAGGWVGLIRESLKSQVFTFGHEDFLAVSATHGPAHFALFDQAAWDRYNLAPRTAGKFASNTLIAERPEVSPLDDLQDVNGFYEPNNSTLPALQNRGMVFVACHLHPRDLSWSRRQPGAPRTAG